MTDDVLKSKLCYIKGDWAYFTTGDLDKVDGDDFDDAPYQHNSGPPSASDGDIYQIAFDCDLLRPCDPDDANTRWFTVEEINRGDIPWLRSPDWRKTKVALMAGATLAEFMKAVASAWGTCYLPAQQGCDGELAAVGNPVADTGTLHPV